MEGSDDPAFSDGATQTVAPGGFPELSPLGKRLELLRIERGISKQRLAQFAGTSRQQLWRVMTGKSELTSSLALRLAQALQVDQAALTDAHYHALGAMPAPTALIERAPRGPAPASLAEFVRSPELLERTLGTMPGGEEGRALKRAFLDAIEDVAASRALTLPPELFSVRRRVVNGEL